MSTHDQTNALQNGGYRIQAGRTHISSLDVEHASRYIRASISSYTYSMSFITRTRQARKAYRLESPMTGGRRHYGDHLSSLLVDASTDGEPIDTG